MITSQEMFEQQREEEMQRDEERYFHKDDLIYLQWWSFEISNCLDEKDLIEFSDFYHEKIQGDENIQVLIKQRREELSGNPIENIRNGELLKIRGTGGVYHAIHLLAGRED